ncbi:MAG: ABC transporter permease [Gammaproteobacteria bacterium]|nr:ABC transporter permease [Gammaproteobacteria bacterium]
MDTNSFINPGSSAAPRAIRPAGRIPFFGACLAAPGALPQWAILAACKRYRVKSAMFVVDVLRQAVESIGASLFRALLTMLGMIIGVAAVVTMVSLGTGAQRAVEEQMEALGADILAVTNSQRRFWGVALENSSLGSDDALALRRDGRHLGMVVPKITQRLQLEFGNRNARVEMVGTTSEYAPLHRYELAMGRMFVPAEEQARLRVAVLGSEVPERLETSAGELLDRNVQLAGTPFKVIGVMEEAGSAGMQNPNDDVLIPLPTAQYRVTGSDRLDSMDVQIKEGSAVEQALVDIERILRREHRIRPGEDNDFGILDRRQFLEVRQETARIFALLLPAIAGVSLVVGGIGIMNIMLVTVAERTREIGVRRAIGATRGAIMWQILVESSLLCLLGGLLGVACGWAVSELLAQFFNWQTVVAAEAVLFGLGCSLAIGVVFGLWPARRAATLDPIEALRHE